MINFLMLLQDYNEYKGAKEKREYFRKEIKEYYASHNIREIQKNCTNCPNEYTYDDVVNSNKEYRTFELLKVMKEHYESRLKDVKYSKQVLNQGNVMLISNDNKIYLYFLDTDEKREITHMSGGEISYLISSFNHSDEPLIIGSFDDIPLAKNLINEIKNNNNTKLLLPKQASSYFNSELRYADNFEGNKLLKNSNLSCVDKKIDYQNELNKLIKKYSSYELMPINDLIRYYQLKIIITRDVESVYNETLEEYKPYVIEAYKYISDVNQDIENNYYNVHVRTRSKLINENILNNNNN